MGDASATCRANADRRGRAGAAGRCGCPDRWPGGASTTTLSAGQHRIGVVGDEQHRRLGPAYLDNSLLRVTADDGDRLPSSSSISSRSGLTAGAGDADALRLATGQLVRPAATSPRPVRCRASRCAAAVPADPGPGLRGHSRRCHHWYARAIRRLSWNTTARLRRGAPRAPGSTATPLAGQPNDARSNVDAAFAEPPTTRPRRLAGLDRQRQAGCRARRCRSGTRVSRNSSAGRRAAPCLRCRGTPDHPGVDQRDDQHVDHRVQ